MADKLDRTMIDQKAQAVWDAMDKNERAGVRFGMFPAGPMRKAEAELKAAGCETRDAGRLLSVALMNIASANGGMRA
jgi:hypothetical protein